MVADEGTGDLDLRVGRERRGLGDTLQFVRYAPLVRQRGGYVILECQPPLVRLLTGVQGVDQLIATGRPLPV